MKIDRRLTLIGVMLVVLSMTMATQYATTRVTYTFGIVHPSNADIRFIGSDNSSADSMKVLRVTNNNSGTQFVAISLGDWQPNSIKNYTAAFGIVNEEAFSVNITHINITGTNATFLTMWLHGDRDAQWLGDTSSSVKVVKEGVALYNDNSAVWKLAAGNGNPDNMCADASTQLTTNWDDTSKVRYSWNDANNSVNETSDFVWVGVSLDLDQYAQAAASVTGTIYIHFKAG